MDVWNKFKLYHPARIWKVSSDGAVTTTTCSGGDDVVVEVAGSDDVVPDACGSEVLGEEEDSDGCLYYDVEETSCEEDDEKREDGERIAEVEMMLDTSNKVIDRLTSQLQVEKVTLKKMIAANAKLVEKLNEREKDIADLQKFKTNYWERNLHFALSMMELDEMKEKNAVSFLWFKKGRERRRLQLIDNLKERLTRDINNNM